MDWIEVTARTLAEAKELALDRLGVVEDELEYEVLDDARSGLFGIGRVDARIRARVKPLSRDKPSDRRRRRKPTDRPARSNRGAGNSGGDRSASKGAPAAAAAGAANDSAGDGPTRSGGSSSNRRRRGGRGRSRNGSGGSGDTDARPDADAGVIVQTDREGPEVEVDSVAVGAQAEHAVAFTEQLVRVMGFPASVRSEIDEDDVTIHVDGDGLGPLVGPRGATLQALEEVVRAAVQHHAGGHSAWVHVDVGGYRERRREALATFARKIADDVRASGSPQSLEPMGAADRKVVHDTLADVDGVETGSEGEDPRRRVVIRPA